MPLSALQQKFAAQLQGGQFRSLNESLYTQTGSASLAMMRANPSLFTAYHAGFRTQVTAWPRNPLDTIIAELRRAPRGQEVADFGCGEARLAATLAGGPSPHCARVHSFDLVAPPGSTLVTACDMAHVPLPSATVHSCVFCLSLMGTDYMAFLGEGVRVLRPGGRLLVAEIRSRFEASSAAAGAAAEDQGEGAAGGASRKRPREQQQQQQQQPKAPAAGPSGGLQAFIAAVAALGCTLEKKDESNKMFVFLTFVKRAGGEQGEGSSSSSSSQGEGQGGGQQRKKHKHKAGKWQAQGSSMPAAAAAAAAEGPALKPCVYKKR